MKKKSKKIQQWDEKKDISRKKKKKKQKKDGIKNNTKKIKKNLTNALVSDIENLKNLIPNKSGIYKILNKKNGKFYIGSALNIKKRLYRGHLELLRLNKHFNKHLQRAWNKHGEEVFTFEIIEYIEKTKLIEREQYYLDRLLFAQEYIRKENRKFFELGYNLRPTANNQFGWGVSVLRYSLDGLFIDEWDTIIHVKETLGISAVSQVCKMKQGSAGGYIWKYKEYDKEIENKIDVTNYSIKKIVPVLQYSLEGKFIKEWSCTTHAEKKYKTKHIGISLNCSKGRKTCKGFIWILKENDNYPKKISIEKYKKFSYQARKVLQYSLEGKFIKEWVNISEAEKKLFISNSAICGCCKRKRKTSGGFIWRYKENEFIPLEIDVSFLEKNVIRKKVLQYSLADEFIKEWENSSEAGNFYNVGNANINRVCNGVRPTSAGFKWKYKEENK